MVLFFGRDEMFFRVWLVVKFEKCVPAYTVFLLSLKNKSFIKHS